MPEGERDHAKEALKKEKAAKFRKLAAEVREMGMEEGDESVEMTQSIHPSIHPSIHFSFLLNAYLLLDPNPVEIVSHELTSHHSSHAKQIIRRRRAKIYDEESMGLTTKILEVKLGGFGSGSFWFGGTHNRGFGFVWFAVQSGSSFLRQHSLRAHS